MPKEALLKQYLSQCEDKVTAKKNLKAQKLKNELDFLSRIHSIDKAESEKNAQGKFNMKEHFIAGNDVLYVK